MQPASFLEVYCCCLVFVPRHVVPGGAGDAMAPPDYGRSFNPIPTGGGGILCPPNITACPSRFENITTPMQMRDNYAAEKYAPYAFLLELKKFSGGFTYLF